LLPFIENCIKHGVLDDNKNPVLFSVKANRKKLIIEVENQINKKLKDDHSGIGLTNLEKRLQFYFPNRHTFKVTNDQDSFKSYLEIQL
jgi:LytS/YehU family sensor histidine kinase